jgi:hypothetical protein
MAASLQSSLGDVLRWGEPGIGPAVMKAGAQTSACLHFFRAARSQLIEKIRAVSCFPFFVVTHFLRLSALFLLFSLDS